MDDLNFFRALSRDVTISELKLLGTEAGFLPPVSFDFGKVRSILATGKLPSSDFIEYSWALAECEFSRLATYSNSIRIFLSSIFAYCSMREPLGTRLESDFYWLGVEAALHHDNRQVSSAFLDFLERLLLANLNRNDHQEYLCSLSICFLRIGLGLGSGSPFEERLAWVESWVSGKMDSDITDSLHGLEPWRAIPANQFDSVGAYTWIAAALPAPARL